MYVFDTQENLEKTDRNTYKFLLSHAKLRGFSSFIWKSMDLFQALSMWTSTGPAVGEANSRKLKEQANLEPGLLD